MLAPIVLFVYNRPWHTGQTLNALFENELADQSVLYIYADGPKEDPTDDQLKKIDEVRQVIRSRKWCKEIHIIESEKNKGLADSIISGVTEIVNQYGKVIVLEDDIVTSKGFLKYMNAALELYENEEKVMSVAGFMFPINSLNLPPTFFYAANSCWGWGTWKRAWIKYNNDALDIYLKLINKKIDWGKFNAFQGNEFKEQLLANIEKSLNTWAVKWHSIIHLYDATVLHPKKSLVRNIGFDGSGINCQSNSIKQEIQLAKTIVVNKEEVIENYLVNNELKKYFNEINSPKIIEQPSSALVSRSASEAIATPRFRNQLKKFLYARKTSKTPELNPNFYMTNGEYERLKIMPRYLSSETTLFGNKFTVVDSVTYLSSLDEIFKEEIYKFEPKDYSNITIIDCGANVGLATIYFKRNFPTAKILSYEADPKIFKVLQQNLISFRFNDIEVVNAAISDKDGSINFLMEGGHSGMITDDEIADNVVSVKAVRLKKILEKLEEVTFLKMDIEGHEANVIPDIAEELKKVKFLFLEYHSFIDKKQKLDNLLSIVSKAGFRYYIKESANKKLPFIEKELFLKMDLLVNIFCYRD